MPRFVHDQRTGAGYGSLKSGFQSSTSSASSTFPYSEESSPPEDADDAELNLRALISKSLCYNNLSRPPERTSRTDRFTMSKNRLDLSESESNARTLIGLVPFPMKKFDGPAIGGTSVNPSYTVAPGRIDGSPYGWTKGAISPLLPIKNAPERFLDVIDPAVRERVKKNLKIARLK